MPKPKRENKKKYSSIIHCDIKIQEVFFMKNFKEFQKKNASKRIVYMYFTFARTKNSSGCTLDWILYVYSDSIYKLSVTQNRAQRYRVF